MTEEMTNHVILRELADGLAPALGKIDANSRALDRNRLALDRNRLLICDLVTATIRIADAGANAPALAAVAAELRGRAARSVSEPESEVDDARDRH